jgi:hypothetical protein
LGGDADFYWEKRATMAGKWGIWRCFAGYCDSAAFAERIGRAGCSGSINSPEREARVPD